MLNASLIKLSSLPPHNRICRRTAINMLIRR